MRPRVPLGSAGMVVVALVAAVLLLSLIARAAAPPFTGFNVPRWLSLGSVKIEILGLLWCSGFVLIALQVRRRSEATCARAVVYQFVLAILALSFVIWIGLYAWKGSYIPELPWHYWVISAGIVAIFFSAAFRANVTALSRGRVARDVQAWSHRPLSWLFVAGWSAVFVNQAASRGVPGSPEDEIGRFASWYGRQLRQEMPPPLRRSAKVVLVEFVDYQCPVCRRFAETREAVLAALSVDERTSVQVIDVDFPLERECNHAFQDITVDLHPAACEAAIAARIVRNAGGPADWTAWLWRNQARLTRQAIEFELKASFGRDLEREYPRLLEAIRADVNLGIGLNVRQTPSVWLNGINIPPVSAALLTWAVRHELGSGPLLAEVVQR